MYKQHLLAMMCSRMMHAADAEVYVSCVHLQIETVLHKILHELKVLYARHAPQLKPRKTSTGKSSSATSSSASSGGSSSNSSNEQLSCEQMITDASGCNGGNTGLAAISSLDVVDPVTDVYNILEGSALVPFTEVRHIAYTCCAVSGLRTNGLGGER